MGAGHALKDVRAASASAFQRSARARTAGSSHVRRALALHGTPRPAHGCSGPARSAGKLRRAAPTPLRVTASDMLGRAAWRRDAYTRLRSNIFLQTLRRVRGSDNLAPAPHCSRTHHFPGAVRRRSYLLRAWATAFRREDVPSALGSRASCPASSFEDRNKLNKSERRQYARRVRTGRPRTQCGQDVRAPKGRRPTIRKANSAPGTFCSIGTARQAQPATAASD